MEAAQALAELTQLSSQVERAVILRADGSLLAATTEDTAAAEALTQAALDLVAAAFELRSTPDEVNRVEVELAEGAVFVLRDGGRTIAATTGPRPTAGLVVYDLRTCLNSIDEGKPTEKPKRRKPKSAEE